MLSSQDRDPFAARLAKRQQNTEQIRQTGKGIAMANMLLSPDERSLTPQQVERLDRRRRRGQLLLVLCGQFLVVSTLLLLWTGQDLVGASNEHTAALERK